MEITRAESIRRWNAAVSRQKRSHSLAANHITRPRLKRVNPVNPAGYVTTKEAAVMMNTCVRRVYLAIDRANLPTTTYKAKLYVHSKSIIEYLKKIEEGKVGSASAQSRQVEAMVALMPAGCMLYSDAIVALGMSPSGVKKAVSKGTLKVVRVKSFSYPLISSVEEYKKLHKRGRPFSKPLTSAE